MLTTRKRLTFVTVLLGSLITAGESWGVADNARSANTTVATQISQTAWEKLELNKDTTAQQAINVLRQRTLLHPGHSLITAKNFVNRQGKTITRIKLLHAGIPVMGVGVIMHTDQEGNVRQIGSIPDIAPIQTTPTLSAAEAQVIIQQLLADPVLTVDKIKVKLKIKLIKQRILKTNGQNAASATATDYEQQIIGSRLIYRASVRLNDLTGPHRYVFEIDAHSGELLLKYDGLDTGKASASNSFFPSAKTAPAPKTPPFPFEPASDSNIKVGNGRSQYSGLVTVPVMSSNEVRDEYVLSKGVYVGSPDIGNDKIIIDIRNFQGNDQLYYIDHKDVPQFTTDKEDYVWGNGANFTKDDIVSPDSLINPHAQTAAVDVLYGAMVTWDLWQNVFQHTGLDGAGNNIFIAGIHVGTEGDKFKNNAYFDDGTAYFPDAEPDGKQLTSPDIIGHELAHGFFRLIWESYGDQGDWDNFGEQGGINEANSDIMGTLVEFYETLYPNGAGDTIPTTGGNWTTGENFTSTGTPIRYFYKPSKDGKYKVLDNVYQYVASYDARLAEINTKKVNSHYSSGPMNRMFYFLSEGAQPSWGEADYTSDYLPDGMSGIGIHKAGRIWHLALTEYLNPGFDFKSMRNACELAAGKLYGKFSDEQKAVQDAFAAVNVGPPAERTAPKITLSTSGPYTNRLLHVELVDASGVQGGRIDIIKKDNAGNRTIIVSSFLGTSAVYNLGNVSPYVFKISVTATDTDGNEAKKIQWFDYALPTIDDIRCTEPFNHRRILRTCSVTVTDGMSINRLEYEVGNEISGVVYRLSSQAPGINTTVNPIGNTICDVCTAPDWPVPVSHTFEFEVDFRDATSPGNFLLKTTAFDNAGNKTSTNGVVSLPVDVWAPILFNMSATDNAEEVELRATIFDEAFGRVYVTFYIDDEIVCEYSDHGWSNDLFQPVCRNTTSLSNGSHTFTAKATDRWGNGIQKSISFAVDNGNSPPSCSSTFYEVENNGDTWPNTVPPCTKTIIGNYDDIDDVYINNGQPLDAFRILLQPGQELTVTSAAYCSFAFLDISDSGWQNYSDTMDKQFTRSIVNTNSYAMNIIVDVHYYGRINGSCRGVGNYALSITLD